MTTNSPRNWIAIWAVSQLVSLISATLLFSLGLILVEFILFPLSLGVTALFTGLAASWASNRLLEDELEATPGAIVLWCEAAAALISVLLIIASGLGMLPRPPIVIVVLASTSLALVASYAAGKIRRPVESTPLRKWWITLWIALALLAIPLVIFVASLLGWAGA